MTRSLNPRRTRLGAWLLTIMAVALAIVMPGRQSLDAQIVPARPPLITAETERAIERAMAYLARTQSRDGSWRSGGAMGSYPTTMTSLAGLALMAGGNTPVEGKYARNVRMAVDFVLASATRTKVGNGQYTVLAHMGEEQRSMYSHGFGMLFLAEAYGMEQDVQRQNRIKRVLEEAAQLTSASQSAAGGWLYTPDSGGDEGSVTITQIQGLRAARNAGIKVDRKTIDNAIGYIEKSANPDGGIRYQVRGGGQSLPAITAAAVAVLYNAGEYEHPIAEGCLQYMKNLIRDNPARLGQGHKFYTMLYLGQAMFMSSETNWAEYFPPVRDDLLKTQAADGSWNGDHVGETYGTAIALLTLQLPYKYLPILQR